MRFTVDDPTHARFVFYVVGKVVRRESVSRNTSPVFTYFFDDGVPVSIAFDADENVLYTLVKSVKSATRTALYAHDVASERGSMRALEADAIAFKDRLVAYESSGKFFDVNDPERRVDVAAEFDTFACSSSGAIYASGRYSGVHRVDFEARSSIQVSRTALDCVACVGSIVYGSQEGSLLCLAEDGECTRYELALEPSFGCCTHSNRIFDWHKGVVRKTPFNFAVPMFSIEASPVTALLKWQKTGETDKTYDVHVTNVTSAVTRTLKTKRPRILLTNLIPETTYEVSVTNQESKRFRTLPLTGTTVGTLKNHIVSGDDDEDVWDFRALGPSFGEIRKHLRSLVPQGSKVSLRFAVGKKLLEETMRLAHVGNTLQLDDNHVYVPFETTGQTCKLASGRLVVALQYGDDAMHVDGIRIPFGRSCVILGRPARIFKGSAVILFDDVTREDFPQSNAMAGDIFESGTLAANTLLTRGVVYVNESSEDQVSNSFYVLDGSSYQEVTRESVGIDESASFATYGVGVLRTDDLGVQTIEPTLETCSTETKITSTTTESTTSLVIDADGVSWDSDAAALYFGSAKEFRIRFTAEDTTNSARLSIQALDAGSYQTKLEVSK